MGKFLFGLVVGAFGTSYLIGKIVLEQKNLYDSETAELNGELQWRRKEMDGKNKEA